jgi:hypothetical protein
MINNHIEIIDENHVDISITQIEYIIEYLNNSSDDSENIEKELEEKYKEEINNLNTFHDINLLDKCFTTKIKSMLYNFDHFDFCFS